MHSRHAAAFDRPPARAAIVERARARHDAEAARQIDGEAGPDIADAATSLLLRALDRYAAASSFAGAFDDAEDVAVRPMLGGAVAFRDFEGRITGTLEPKRLRLRFAGVTAARLMRDVVLNYCEGPDGPRPAQTPMGATMVHVASMRMTGGRVMRHVCHDGDMADVASGTRVRAATLLLKPTKPETLILRDPLPAGRLPTLILTDPLPGSVPAA